MFMNPVDIKSRPLGEIAKVTSGGTPSRKEPSYWNGTVPWVTTSLIDFSVISATEECITEEGVENSSAKVFPKGTILMAMFGQGVTRGKVGVLGIDAAFNQACVGIIPNPGVDAGYLYQFLAQNYEAIRQLSNAGSQENLNAALIKGIPVPLPELGEQEAISQFASTWDRSIRQLTDLIATKLRFKQGLMQQLLTGQRRFPGFTGVWPSVRMADIAHEVSERNTKGGEVTVLSCTKHGGLVDSLAYFGKRVFSEDTSAYKVVRRGQFAYATNHIEEGSIGLLTHTDAGLVSPMYTVFRTNGQVLPEYLYRVFKTETMRQVFASFTSASVNRRGSLRWKQFSTIQLRLPSKAEQAKINELMAVCDCEIDLLRRELDALKQQKRGLMQKLLTGQIRVPTGSFEP